jgi:hypothetical protein
MNNGLFDFDGCPGSRDGPDLRDMARINMSSLVSAMATADVVVVVYQPSASPPPTHDGSRQLGSEQDARVRTWLLGLLPSLPGPAELVSAIQRRSAAGFGRSSGRCWQWSPSNCTWLRTVTRC